MTESNTRKWWRARLGGIVMQSLGDQCDIEGWLDDLMQTPELSLAELAESNPNYRLAVVNDGNAYDLGVQTADMKVRIYKEVVKMEER